MQMVRIHIAGRAQRAKALVEMSRRGRVICLPANTFIVPEPALGLLQSLGIAYKELERGGFDYAEKALGDAAAERADPSPGI
jgi:hypothetical protein